MNKAITALALLCGFLLGVIAGPWLWPRNLMQIPAEKAPLPQAAAVMPEPPPPLPPAPPEPLPAPPPPPESELELKGVFVGADAARSRALIASDNGTPRLYKPDDRLPDGSVLKEVNNKDVEIEKNGEMLTLTLQRGIPKATADEPEPVTEPAEENTLPEPSVPPEPAPEETGVTGTGEPSPAPDEPPAEP